MSNNRTVLIALGLVAVVVVIVLAIYTMSGAEEAAAPTDTTNTDDQSTVDEPTDDQTAATTNDSEVIVFTDDGFSAAEYSAVPGDTVTVRNDSSQDLQFSSDNHPTHRDEPALNTPVIAAGDTTTFTAPSEPGEYGFHDHIRSQFTGVLVIE